MLADEEVQALAPAIAFQSRSEPYLGDAVSIDLAQIPPDDISRLRALYDFLSALYDYVAVPVSARNIDIAQVVSYLQGRGHRKVIDQVNQLGHAMNSAQFTPELRKVYHDVRAGSLSALIMHMDFLVSGDGQEADVERLFLLSRDHLKIMRNGIPGLDPAGYQQDLETQKHGIELFREKWDDAEYQLAGQPQAIKVEFSCDFEGSISERCMEFAALDRVIYNLVNNASRYAQDGLVSLKIVPLDGADDTNLRFTVANRISQAQREILESRFGDHLEQLFKGGFTTDGHGLGMRICGDVVTHGYGLPGLSAALKGGYMGVRLLDNYFVVWFHWPGHRQV